MNFSKIGEHTIRCVIAETEIEELGYSLDDIMSNNSRTQDFMNYIIDMAEAELDIDFQEGIKTVRADFLPDHNISLTFSSNQESQAMMEHLKDIINGFLESIPKDKIEEIRKQSKDIVNSSKKQKNEATTKDEGDSYADAKPLPIIAIFTFENMDVLVRFAKTLVLKAIPENELYKEKNKYYLIMDLTGSEEKEVLHLSALTDEYASAVAVGEQRSAHIKEHGTCIIEKEAIQMLRQL